MRRTPWWVPCVIAALALIPPVTHLALSGVDTASGLITGDSGHHLVAMRAIANGFESPYASCQSPLGPADWRYFAPPIFLLYVVAGEVGRLLGVSMFLWLGICNGLGGALYLWTVWRFLRTVAPGLAPRGFLLFTLGGGLGGVAYLFAVAAGAPDWAGFERVFERFAWYELIEGQHLRPDLLFHRLYYTLALAAGYAGLTAWVESLRGGCARHLGFAGFLMGLCALLNARLGVPMLAVGLLYSALGSEAAGPWRRRCGLAMAGAVALGSAGSLALIAQHPAYAENVRGITAEAMRLLPFLTQAGPSLALAALGLFGMAGVSRGTRAVLGACAGYLAVFTGLYFAHQAYYGNWTHGGEGRGISVWASDWGLLGFAIGAVIGWWRPPMAVGRDQSPPSKGDLGGCSGDRVTPTSPQPPFPLRGASAGQVEGGLRGGGFGASGGSLAVGGVAVDGGAAAGERDSACDDKLSSAALLQSPPLKGDLGGCSGGGVIPTSPQPPFKGGPRAGDSGGVEGVGIAERVRAGGSGPTLPRWVAVWLGVFLCAALSGWGGGLWLEASPQRLMVLSGPPLALAAAAGLGRLGGVAARSVLAGIVALGVVSVTVSALYFQGPLARASGVDHFAHLRYDVAHPADAAIVSSLPPGTYAVPAWNPVAFGEVIAQRPGMRVLGGPGAMNLGDQPLARVQAAVDALLAAGRDDATRAAVVRAWCVDFVFASNTAPLAEEARADLLAWAARHGLPHRVDGLAVWIDVRALR